MQLDGPSRLGLAGLGTGGNNRDVCSAGPTPFSKAWRISWPLTAWAVEAALGGRLAGGRVRWIADGGLADSSPRRWVTQEASPPREDRCGANVGQPERRSRGCWLAPAGPTSGSTRDVISSGTGNPVCPKFGRRRFTVMMTTTDGNDVLTLDWNCHCKW